MSQNICVYAASSEKLAPAYLEAAAQLGALIAQNGNTLIYGGGELGLMGAVASAVHEHGGTVVAVIPESLLGQKYDAADEMVVTRDLRDRKAIMEERADAFISLPGGFGTLEEVLEVLTLKQLGFHDKPVVLLNTEGFYDPLVDVFEHLYTERFANAAFRVVYHLAPDAPAAMGYLATYAPPVLPRKWKPKQKQKDGQRPG